MSTPEGRIVQKIVKALEADGIFVFKVHGGPTMLKGLPDLICCVEGRYVGIEVKTPQTHTNVSPSQHLIHTFIRNAGGTCEVACSVADAHAIIEKARKKTLGKPRAIKVSAHDA